MPAQTYPWTETYKHIGLSWDMNIPARPVFAMLDDTVRDYGSHPAFDFLGKRYSWTQIGKMADQFAAGLQKLGVGKGVKVGLFLPNSPTFLIAYYGILKSGATIVNFNPLYAERELEHQIADSETDYMITLDLEILYGRLAKMMHKVRLKKIIVGHFTENLPFPKNILFPLVKSKEMTKVQKADHTIWLHDLLHNDGQFQTPAIDPHEDIAVLQYTGGTTGVPKGAMLTHYNVYANTLQSLAWFPNVKKGELKKILGVLPFFHVFAMTAIMNFSVLAGLEIVAMPRFDLKEALKIIHKKKPHFFPAVPAIYSAINTCHDLKNYNLSSLEYCISGGAPLPVEVKKTFEKITGCIVVEGYGLTESSPVACANPIHGENMAGSIGLPVPGTIVEIIDPKDKSTPIEMGQRGELCIRGPQVMRGYWNRPTETWDVLKNGRLHTGDIAIMDARGYVYIVDRLKDMIITNGYNVYPRNVEEAIYAHPAIEECIVAGLPDAQRGEVVKAWVKLKSGYTLSEQDLKTFLTDRISKMEMPKHIEMREKPLPKTMIGKLSRKDILAEELQKKS